MPKKLQELLASVGAGDAEKKESELKETEKFNYSNYLGGKLRKIDVMLLCALYGIFISKELPPEDKSEIKHINGSYEFSARIDRAAEMIQNSLLLMWTTENQDISDRTSLNYRRDLYDFIGKILDADYMTNTILPFYLSKSFEVGKGTSFLDKLASSGYVEWKMRSQAPEHIALDFISKRRKFEKYLKKGLKAILR